MNKIALTTIGACCLTAIVAMAQETMPPRSEDSADRMRTADAASAQRSKMSSAEFVKKAAEGGMAEVAAGKLGSQKATSPEVKAYAQKMVTDHGKANKELMAAAKTKNLEVPTEPGMMHKGMAEKLEHQKADADWDEDFMEQMVRDHEKTVELFQQASTDMGVDADLRTWAKGTLPTLQMHLKDAKALEAKLDKKD